MIIFATSWRFQLSCFSKRGRLVSANRPFTNFLFKSRANKVLGKIAAAAVAKQFRGFDLSCFFQYLFFSYHETNRPFLAVTGFQTMRIIY